MITLAPWGVSKRSLGCALVHAMCSPRRVLVLVVRQRNGDPGPRILHHQGIDHKLIYNDQQWGVRALPRGPNHGGDHTGGQKLHFSDSPAKRNRHFRTAAGVGKMNSRGGPAFKIRRKRGGRPGRQGPFQSSRVLPRSRSGDDEVARVPFNNRTGPWVSVRTA